MNSRFIGKFLDKLKQNEGRKLVDMYVACEWLRFDRIFLTERNSITRTDDSLRKYLRSAVSSLDRT